MIEQAHSHESAVLFAAVGCMVVLEMFVKPCTFWSIKCRGNQAYEIGDFSKAEECYSLGAGSVSSHITSQSCVRALTLCYSNRAATRMAVGKMRDAIGDCLHAMAVDPKFLRVRLRLAK